MPTLGSTMHEQHEHLPDDMLIAGLDGELTDDRLVAYARGVASCTVCARRAAQLGRASEGARGLLRGEAPDGVPGQHERARARLNAALRVGSPGGAHTWTAWFPEGAGPGFRWALAAAALLLVTVGGALQLRGPADDEAAVRAALPQSSLTPGAWSSVRPDELCATETITPPIPASVRDQVLSSYGMERVPPDQYELDYLVTPELGGVPDPQNLWPQPYMAEPWNALVKDELERLLSSMVCSGRLDLRVAQTDMAQDWVAAYRKYFKTRDPLRTHVGGPPDFIAASTSR